VWGPARYAEYRVALDAPAATAASVVEPGVARSGLGPLTEVVAQHHRFAELAPHLDRTVAEVVAQERVLRGEDLRGARGLEADPFAPSLVLAPFEPAYALPTYRAAERLDGDPTPSGTAGGTEVAPAGGRPATSGAAAPVEATRVAAALTDLVAEWTARSAGTVRSASVRGELPGAVAAVVDAPARWWPLTLPDLLGELARAGASGGVHGRRRGGAAGRAGAWWAAAVATGLDAGGEGMDPDELEFRMEDLVLARFEVGERARPAWRLGVAIADPVRGWAVAFEAVDDGDDGDDGEDDGGHDRDGRDV
jgi:hypothetical protein